MRGFINYITYLPANTTISIWQIIFLWLLIPMIIYVVESIFFICDEKKKKVNIIKRFFYSFFMGSFLNIAILLHISFANSSFYIRITSILLICLLIATRILLFLQKVEKEISNEEKR